MAATLVSTLWIVAIGTSVVCFAIKYLGHVIPATWLSSPRFQRINEMIPVVLLAALVMTQTFTTKTHLVIDHRLAGLATALVALRLRAPFPVVVISAAVVSAVVYHLH